MPRTENLTPFGVDFFFCGLLSESRRETDFVFTKYSSQLPKTGPVGAHLAGEGTEHFHSPMERLAVSFHWQELAASKGSVFSSQEALQVRDDFPETGCRDERFSG